MAGDEPRSQPSPSGSASLAPPVNEELTRRAMERSPSQTMRAEKEDLKEAAEDSFNVVMDLTLDGKVSWVSPSWETVIGTARETIINKPIADILVEDKDAFRRAVETMKGDDSRSYKLRFSVAMGSLSTLPKESEDADSSAEVAGFHMDEVVEQTNVLSLEGQGILIYDKATMEVSHTMWVIRPFVEPTEITIDLPPILVESLGVGAGMLARYLTGLAEQNGTDPENNPPPLPVLCRICERQIQPWWFEKHSELCMLEHKAESDVQLCQENLGMHRQAIVKILDAMERRTARPVSGEMSASPPPIEYRGMPIGPSSSHSSGTASPGTPPLRSRDQSASGIARSRSFPARRPLVRIVELLLDLCDTSMEISTPAIKDNNGTVEMGTFRTQSPQSEARINQVLQWQSPTTSMEEEKGLAMLCRDTEAVARAKVDAVFRHRNTIEYSERIRLEFSMLVQDCIDEAVRKASSNDDVDNDYSNTSDVDEDTPFFEPSFDSALQRTNSNTGESQRRGRVRRQSSPHGSGTTSPMECSTPRSQVSQQSLHRAISQRRSRYSHRSSMQFESETADSDTSAKSSLAAAIGHAQTESPVSDHELTTKISATSRERKRHSAIQQFPAANSPKRQVSPARVASSSSPLRIAKPRTSMYENMPTPITSPLLSTGDFSPALEHNFHHRRQSSATLSDPLNKGAPNSPHLSSVGSTQQNRAIAPSIKDFEIIKPISKGAFGSVYLSKKKSTGDYFAIKVLKKADMIAKNQVTNVRAERAIMMVQGESDFVAKLFWTFASKDYLYLVMEYLNGGDCAALIKVLGGLSEEWAQRYLAEVVLGLEHLHSRGIVHRDLKPDNLLIDQKGHLKLTDFGLSRMGLIGRQKRVQNMSSESTPDLLKQGPFVRPKSVTSSRSASFDYPAVGGSPSSTPSITPDNRAELIAPSYFNLNLTRENTLSRENSLRRTSNPRSETGGTDHLATMLGNFTLNEPPPPSLMGNRRTPPGEEDSRSETSQSSDVSGLGLHHVTSHSSQSQVQPTPQPMAPPPLALFDPEDNNRKFVGTPDYLAPETINGSGQDEMSDWWSLGCILFEFLYGYPPFHAETPDEVFENILARRIDWPDEEDEDCAVSEEAKDLMNKLMCTDPSQRLGSNGAEEVKQHPWFTGVTWESLLEEEPSFIPTPQNPEDTEYFDARGATLQSFVEEMEDQSSTPASTPGADLPERPHDAVSRIRKEVNNKRGLIPLSIPPHVREGRNRRLSEPVAQDDFGNFAFKNLPVLEKANKDVIQKLRSEALKSTPALTTSNPVSPSESSPGSNKSLSRTMSSSSNKNGNKRPVSPSNAHHHANSSPARVSQPSSPLLLSFTANNGHDKRKASSASASSSLSQQSNSSSLIPGPLTNIPCLSTSTKPPTASQAASPVKPPPKVPVAGTPSSLSTSPTRTSHEKPLLPTSNPQAPSQVPSRRISVIPRVRSLTVGSTDSDGAASTDSKQQHRRSQVFDYSPSSSDNEDVKSGARQMRIRRRQSARRMSTISFQDTPTFRPLDVLVCEDHPVSRMVMERLLEKLKCRAIVVENGSEAMRYAMGEVKFDIILMEFKLPQINGEDVARMIRTSRNPNSSTPIVAVTGYLKDLADPQHFDELIEKPATPSKLKDVLRRQCFWEEPPEERPTLGDRKASFNRAAADSGRMSPSVERFMAGRMARKPMDDDESVSVASSNDPVLVTRADTNEWEKLDLSSTLTSEPDSLSHLAPLAPLTHQESAPPRLQWSQPSSDRTPSPLSNYVSAGTSDPIPIALPSPPEMAPLPPSITSTPVFGTPSGDLSVSPFGTTISPAPPVSRHLSPPTLSKTPPPEDAVDTSAVQPSLTKSTEEKPKYGFSMLFSGRDKSQSRASSTSPPRDSKCKPKRSSFDKKKEKFEKLQKEGLTAEEADADDEDSITGGKKPSKSRSIGELIINRVKRSPPEIKRTKSSEGRNFLGIGGGDYNDGGHSA